MGSRQVVKESRPGEKQHNIILSDSMVLLVGTNQSKNSETLPKLNNYRILLIFVKCKIIASKSPTFNFPSVL